MMSRIMRGAACIAATAGMLSIGAAAGTAGMQSSGTAPSGALRALAVRYADGRTTERPLSTRGRASWTVTFPRVPGVDASRDGLPLSALQFEEAPDPPGLVVTLALLYGHPHQKRVQVASVRLTDDRAARVSELEAYGVKPVTLSLVSLPPPQLYIPSVISPSSDLAFETDVQSEGEPGYRIAITNQSSRAVTGLAFAAFRGRTKSISGAPRGNAHTPLIAPGATYTLRFGAAFAGDRRTGGPHTWLPIDRVEITSVIWSDEIVEGDPVPAARQRVLAAGTARQVARIVDVLRGAAEAPAAPSIAVLRAAVTALPVAIDDAVAEAARSALPDPGVIEVSSVRQTMQSGMQNAKNAVLNDLTEFERSAAAADPSAYHDWLRAMTNKFDVWRHRILDAPR